ncbi:hypothetical protein MNB_SV-14-1288 [hydrothermal vent metagenome]|uniref:YkuD domain-containing protein n=1 Tax=hydrothermal vent metagenome TaxID=652676 RepID=A0A1W1CIU6_9ZZZZ
MKKLILLTFTLLLFTTCSIATSTYYKNSYVTVSCLHRIFEKAKRNSDVSERALANAFAFYEKNRFQKRLSPHYLAIADYTKVALHKRLYIINLHTGEVSRYLVAHGINSGERYGRVVSPSNAKGSCKTPIGFFKVGLKEGITTKKRYNYLCVYGLEWKNRNARKRQILLHTAWYVAKGGRSYGCFAIDPKDRVEIFSKLKTALLYSYAGI